MTPEMIEVAFAAFAARIATIEARLAELEGDDTAPAPPPVAPPPVAPPPATVYTFDAHGLLTNPAPTIVGDPSRGMGARVEAIVGPDCPNTWTSPTTGHTLVYPISGEGLMGYATRVSAQCGQAGRHGVVGGLALGAGGQMGPTFRADDQHTWPENIDRWFNRPFDGGVR